MRQCECNGRCADMLDPGPPHEVGAPGCIYAPALGVRVRAAVGWAMFSVVAAGLIAAEWCWRKAREWRRG